MRESNGRQIPKTLADLVGSDRAALWPCEMAKAIAPNAFTDRDTDQYENARGARPGRRRAAATEMIRFARNSLQPREDCMSFTLETFAAKVRDALQRDPSPSGREQVRALVEEALRDEPFIKQHINDNTPDRQVIYEDPDMGFCVCAHVNRGAREANPHDHGSSWAIYGQAFGETEMSDWEIIEPADEGKAGKVRRARVYTLKPGMAHIYNEGDVHSPKRVAATGLLRIEGKNTQKMQRLAYRAV